MCKIICKMQCLKNGLQFNLSEVSVSSINPITKRRTLTMMMMMMMMMMMVMLNCFNGMTDESKRKNTTKVCNLKKTSKS